MLTRRPTALLATTLVAAVAFVVPCSVVAASAPPTEPTDAPAQCTLAAPGGDIVESWALSPGGSLAADQAAQRPDLTYELDRGAVIEDSVTLFNFGTVDLNFRVYATDAFNNADGQFDLLSGDQPPTDVGSWITVAQELITVPACKQATIPITITVPADAAPGDHAGAVLASNESTGTGPEGGAVTLDRRTGTRVYLRVAGELFPELAVAEVDTSYDHALNPLGGEATVTYTIENRGNVRMGGNATLTVGGPFGLGDQTVDLPDVPELLPGESVTVTASVTDVPASFLSFTTVEVVPSDADGAGATSGDDTTFTPPLSILIPLLVLILGVLARRAFRRHRGVDTPEADAGPTPDRTDDRRREPLPV
jgi:hypothetical protein